MPRLAGVTIATVLIGSLAACSAPSPPPAIAGAAMPTPTPGGFDGLYRPPPGGVSGNARCGTTRFGSAIRVNDGVASLQTVTQGRLSGPVAADGSLLIENGNAALRGQFSGNKFDGTYSVKSCAFTLSYTK